MGAIGGVVDFRNCNINFASFNAIRSAQTLRGRDGSVAYLDSGIGMFYNADAFCESEQPILSERRGYKVSLVIDSFNFDGGFVMESYRTYGVEFVGMLDIPFAIALYDGERRMLLLARDKMGKKPLYYTVKGGKVFFSSEPKGVLATMNDGVRVNADILSSHLTSPIGVYGASDIYKDIFEVRRGECVLFTEFGMSKFFYRENLNKNISTKKSLKVKKKILEPFYDIDTLNGFSVLEDSFIAFDIPQFDVYMPFICQLFLNCDKENAPFYFSDVLKRQNMLYCYEREDRLSAFYGKIGIGVISKNAPCVEVEEQKEKIYNILSKEFFSLERNDVIFLRKVFGNAKMNYLLKIFDKEKIKKEDMDLIVRILGMIYQTVKWSKLRSFEFISEGIGSFSI